MEISGNVITCPWQIFSLRVWNLEDKEEICVVPENTHNMKNIKLSNDQSLIATSNDKHLNVWSLLDPTTKNSLVHRAYIHHIAITNDSKYILTVSADDALNIWDHQEKLLVAMFKNVQTYLTCISLGYDNKYIAFGSGYNTIQVWNFQEQIQEIYSNAKERIYKFQTLRANGRFSALWTYLLRQVHKV